MNRLLPPHRIETSLSTIGDAVRLQAALDPERAAIVSAGLPALSFHDLECTIRRIGDDLHSAGVGAASRVGVLMPGGPDAAVVAIAVSAHAICYPLNPALTVEELEAELDRVQLDAVVLPGWAELPAARVTRPTGMLRASKAVGSLADIRLQAVVDVAARRPRVIPSSRSVAIIQTSSGSTGLPKHVLVTHANVLDIAHKLRAWFGVSAADRSACILPVHSPIGFKVSLLAPLLIGSGVVITQKQRAEDIAEWCVDHDPTWFFAVPAYLNAVVDRLRAVGGSLPKHKLRFALTGGTYFPEHLRLELEAALRVAGLEQYGSRESGPITANPAPPAIGRPGTVGPVSADVAILDDDGAALPPGTPGAVAVRGQGISPGYIEALPPGSDTVPGGRSPDDWLLTGDIGAVDTDGFLSIIGRAKQIINRGGEKIAPSEVEKGLLRHPAVREAAVFGVPHPRLGEAVSAAVVLEPEAEASSTDLQAFLFEHLAPHKIPQRVHVVTALPRTKAGKVHVSGLTERFSSEHHQVVPATGNLEALIVEIWQRLLGRSDVGVDDNFFELGGDSLMATAMLLEVEELTKRPIPPSALRAVWTIRHLVFVLLRDMPPVRELVSPAKRGSGTPLFFCHGDHRDRGIYAFRLMDLVTHDRPVFLLNHYRDFREMRDESLEDIARLYVPHLLAAQPAGRFRLGGYCLGGILALEIARQLKARGRDIEFVVLVDSPSLNGHAGLRALRRMLGAVARICPDRIGKELVRNGMWAAWVAVRSPPFGWGAVRKLARAAAVRRSSGKDMRPARWDEYQRLSAYIPARLEAPLHCIVCAENATRVDFKPSNWRRLAPSVRARVVPGDHHACVTKFADAVAAELAHIVSAR